MSNQEQISFFPLPEDDAIVPDLLGGTNATTYNGGGNGVGSSTSPFVYFLPLSEGSGIVSIDNILSRYKWGSSLHSAATLTTSFSTIPGSTYSYASSDAANAATFSATQIAAARTVMAKWAAVANITFSEVVDSATLAGDIRWGQSTDPTLGTAHAYYPTSSAAGGDVWIGPNYPSDYGNPTVGGYGYLTYVHELGHALGLVHPHNGEVAAAAGEDQLKYSVMSYRDYSGDSLNGYNSNYFPTTPMLNDIRAIQWLYGANTTYHSGDDTYSWSPGAMVFEAIWDAGGTDTIDTSNQTSAVILNLASGQWSSVGSTHWNGQEWVRDTLTIAYDVVIEHAIGSSFADQLYGNAANNRLSGGSGNDTISGGDGADTLVGGLGDDQLSGGNGIDTADYSEASGAVTVNLQTGSASGSAGNDTLSGMEILIGGAYSDSLVGGDGNDDINGQQGNDTLAGGGGNDWMVGGSGDDNINGGNGSDTVDYSAAVASVTVNLSTGVVSGAAGNDTLAGIEEAWGSGFSDHIVGDSGDNYLYGNAGDDTVDGGTGIDYLFGGDGSDSLLGGDGNDNLTGGNGNDTVNGGNGIDTAYFAVATVANVSSGTATGAEGNDTLVGIENLHGSTGNDQFTGDSANNHLGGNRGDDVLNGAGGNDTLQGAEGSDTLTGGSGADVFVFGLEAASDTGKVDRITDFEVGDKINFYQSLTGVLSGNVATGLMQGQVMVATPSGGVTRIYVGTDSVAGADITMDLTGSIATNELAISAGDTHDLTRVIPNLTVTGTAGADTLSGGAGHDTIDGADGNDVLIGGPGNDAMNGGTGTDTADYSSAGGAISANLSWGQASGAAGFDTLTAIENLKGSTFADTLVGDANANRLEPGGGNDTLAGGDGSDIFALVATDSATITDFAYGAGGDQLDIAALLTGLTGYTGGQNPFVTSHLRLLQSGGDTLLQRDADGPGVGATWTTVAALQATPAVFLTSANLVGSHNPGSPLSGLTLTGTDASDTLVGAGLDDSLDGGVGSDRLYGQGGNDIYVVDVQGDIVFEGLGGGFDTVYANTNFYLYGNIEQLVLTGAAYFGVGTDIPSVLIGNDQENLLIAYSGADGLFGGAARDAIYGQDGNDTIVGEAGIDYLIGGLGNDVIYGGPDADEIYGQEGNDLIYGGTDFQTDILVGGDGNDTIDGGAAWDQVYGNAGDDVFYVSQQVDWVFEQPGEGTDTVYADSPNGFYLYANLENLTLLGNTPYGVGNELPNILVGNRVGNTLLGGDGNDTLNGGAGTDILYGQGGNDVFVIQPGTQVDILADFATGQDKLDVTAFGFGSVANAKAAMTQIGSDIAFNLGNGDLVIIQNVGVASLTAAEFLL